MEDFESPSKIRKTSTNLITAFAFISIIIGLFLLFTFIARVNIDFSINDKPLKDAMSSYGAFGDYIGGVVGTIFSFTGIILLFLTLKEQRESFKKERLESTFFEMIKFHRENVGEMKYTSYINLKDKETAEKRKVFKEIYAQFKELWHELWATYLLVSIEDLYNEKYLLNLRKNEKIKKRGIDLKILAQIDITYLIIFFGLGEEDKDTIINLTKDKYKEEFIKYVLKYAALKPKRESDYWEKWNNISSNILAKDSIIRKRDESLTLKMNIVGSNSSAELFDKIYYEDNYYKYYGGHQFRLGHYYRHLYHTVNIIHNNNELSQKEKYNYIKIIRTQLSNYEQIVFFINSLSQVGRKWELEDINERKNNLITEYQLIKNIPQYNLINEINVLEYYPNIQYEIIK